MRLILASGSPRRQELLERLGLAFEVEPPGIDESRLPDELAAAYVERIARLKAAAVSAPGRLVVAADTAVVHGGHILGKPAHPQEARSMLHKLEGERHEVFTGMAVAAHGGDPVVVSIVDVTEVVMLPMTAEEIASYVDTGEPMGKAGAYALQGIGGRFVERILGSPFTVIGMPIHLLPRMFARVGASFDGFADPTGRPD